MLTGAVTTMALVALNDSGHRTLAAVLAVGVLVTLVAVFSAAAQPRSSGPSGVSAGAGAAGSRCAAHFPTVIRDGFPEPQLRFSTSGRLDTTLRMAEGPVTINGRRYVTETYDGTFPGPTLVMCPGDNVTVHLINDMTQDTNLHVHGLHVAPNANHDNVYLDIRPHQSFTYQYDLPADHDPGAFWYHPHLHHFVAPQIFAGLSGAIVVEGGLDNLLSNVPQRLMVIQSTELCSPAGRSVGFPGSGTEPCVYPGRVMPVAATNERYTPLFVNGVINPTVKIHPGQIQRWRIFNANDNRIVVLNLRGQALQVLAEDGNTLRWMRPTSNLMIGPGSRREVLVRGGPAGSYQMKALPFAQFPGGDHADKQSRNGGPTPNQTVLTVLSSGRSAHDRFPRGPLSSPVDLRNKRVDRRRVIVFSEVPNTMNMFDFELNGRTFDPHFVAVTMKLNSVEEWTLVNTNTEWHTFHIHVNPFQVMSINGRPLRYVDYQDNVAMPPNSRIVIRMHPTDFTGKFVFHCHVTNHEDRGMMAAVQVVRNPTSVQLQASVARSGGFSISSSAYGARTIVTAPLIFFCHPLDLRLAAAMSRLPVKKLGNLE
jgi:suppressor of ftsI